MSNVLENFMLFIVDFFNFYLYVQRDGIGIGGSWSDFVEYFIASIKSEDIKLVIDGQSMSGGVNYVSSQLLINMVNFVEDCI